VVSPSDALSSTVSLTLWLDAGSGEKAIRLSGADGAYQATIPPQPEGTLVSYYLEAVDALGQRSFYPSTDAASDGTGTYIHDRYLVGYTPPAVYINEFLADNELANMDEAGERDDWVELYNAGETPIALGNMYLSDDLTEPMKWAFSADTVIQPGEHPLIWCDGETGQGAHHANFKLSREGEALVLFDGETGMVIDWIVFDRQHNNVSYGRQTDGANLWTFMRPTPGGMNAP
jgi:hypothetical protein